MYRVIRNNEILKHHGILGMKWGRRNGPPYPLGQGDHSSSEKKAGWKKSLGGGRNEHLYEANQTKKKTGSKPSKESKSKRVASFLDNSYKEDSYKRQDAENAEWVKKQSSLEKRRKAGSTAGVSKKMGKEAESIEDKYRKERAEEHTKRSKEIFDDPELKSDLDKAKKLMDDFYNSDDYDTKLEKQYYKTVEDIGKKIVDKYMGDMSLSSNDYKKYAEYGQDKVFGILEEYDNIFKK